MKKIITPVEIQEKEFNKSFRGYDEEEVDMFLDLISLDLEKLIKENLNLKAQIAAMKKEKSTIGDSNITVTETLETAKTLMDQLAESSEKRAKILVENAELDAARILGDAKLKAETIASNSAEMIRNFENLKREYKNFLDICNKNFDAVVENCSADRLKELLDDNQKKPVTIEKIQRETILDAHEAAAEKMESMEGRNKALEDKIMDDIKKGEDSDDEKTMVNIRYE